MQNSKYLYRLEELIALSTHVRWRNCSLCSKPLYCDETQFIWLNTKTNEQIGLVYCSLNCADFGLLQNI